ncbi:uncharacterized protein LOC111294791 [Durio zibethinus]|uniref:Uncharacterized protein LOC111294791 n=1 Tax=Durio zibethinus TaxID=66656 RepID=A0A6P5YUJ1_DURZI|nr:uncharacterized protein LOC111294791 [Durio zibethinus]
MADDLDNMWKYQSFTEEELDRVQPDVSILDETTANKEKWMVGKLLTFRSFNKDAMISTLKVRPRGFPLDDKNLILMDEYKASLRPSEYQFHRAMFWVRVYGLPLGMRSKEMAMCIVEKIGELFEVDAGNALDRIRQRCKIRDVFGVDATGKSGGFGMMWKDGVQLNLQSFSKNHIDIELLGQPGQNWRITGFSREPKTTERYRTWRLLERLGDQSDEPWLCLGDFNEILFDTEKWGGNPKAARPIENFRLAMERTGLEDLGCRGLWFTWEKGKGTNAVIRKRLHRGLGNKDWMEIVPLCTVTNLVTSTSDHNPILVKTDGCRVQRKNRGRSARSFFEVAWVKDEETRKVIKQGWEEKPHYGIHAKIRHTGIGMRTWASTKFGSLQNRIKVLRDELIELKSMDPNDGSMQRAELVKRELNEMLEREEAYWSRREQESTGYKETRIQPTFMTKHHLGEGRILSVG